MLTQCYCVCNIMLLVSGACLPVPALFTGMGAGGRHTADCAAGNCISGCTPGSILVLSYVGQYLMSRRMFLPYVGQYLMSSSLALPYVGQYLMISSLALPYVGQYLMISSQVLPYVDQYLMIIHLRKSGTADWNTHLY